MLKGNTAWKVSKYGVFFGPYFPVFSSNTGKYVPENTPYLDTFHAVKASWKHPKIKTETLSPFYDEDVWCVARFGTICTF